MLVAVVALLCSVTVSAQDFVVDGIVYNIVNGNASVTYDDHTWYEHLDSVIIPKTVTYDGYTYSVTSIGELAFSDCSHLTSITIPESVTSIGNNAFVNCSKLTSITIPQSVTNIGNTAFYGCSGLISITIPQSVTSIGVYAFYGCSGLISITIPNSVTSIKFGAFSFCTGLTSIEIPNSVTNIEDEAFYGCSGLTSVTIPDSVTSIKSRVFGDCISLKNIIIPNSVTSIEEAAFAGCSNITSVTIPKSVTSIELWAFSNCSSLANIIVEDGNKVYDSRNNCNAIIETAADTLVQGCKNTIIPNSATRIGNYAFSGCSDLISITIPNSVTSIGDYAFYGCSSLTSIYSFNETPAEIYNRSFSNYDATLYIPLGSLAAYKAANHWKKFANIVEFEPTAIEDVAEEVAPAFEITDGGIKLTAAEGKAVAVYSTAGALVEKIDSYAGEEITLDKGVYIVRVGNKAVKVKL